MDDFIDENFGKILIAFIVALIWGYICLLEASCYSKTEGMGFDVEWSYLGGCRIEHKEGQWIPLERYRIIED